MILVNLRLLSHLPLVRELAERLVAAGEEVVFCFEGGVPGNGPVVAAAAEAVGARYADLEELAGDVPAPDEAEHAALFDGDLSALELTDDDRQLAAFHAFFHTRMTAAGALIRELGVDLVVVLQDGAGGNAALIRAAHDAGVRVMCCPYGFGTSRDFDDYVDEKAANGRLHLAEGPVGDWIRTESPGWIRPSDHGDVLMFTPKYVYVREKLGLGLALPWVVHGGAADLLAAESRQMADHYLAEGIDAGKIELTGTVYCDVVRDELDRSEPLAAAVENATKIEPGRTSLLVSMPPNYHQTRPGTNEFASYEELCESIFSALDAMENLDVTVSIHPLVSAEHRTLLESHAPVSDEWILRLIPRSDVLLTAFSSTMRWAIACAKPVLNYNMYGYVNHDYDSAPEVLTTRRLDEAAGRLSELLDDDEYARAAARQQEVAGYWGMLDGRNFERTHAAMRRLREAA